LQSFRQFGLTVQQRQTGQRVPHNRLRFCDDLHGKGDVVRLPCQWLKSAKHLVVVID
jgi:hypothetical protein